MYVITGCVTREVDGYSSTRYTPTFYLDENVQGILSEEHARSIAEHMLADIAGPDAHVQAFAARL